MEMRGFLAAALFICVNLRPSAVEKIQIDSPCLTDLGLTVIFAEMKKRWAVVMFFAGSLLGGLIGYSSRPDSDKLGFKDDVVVTKPRERRKEAGGIAHSQKWQSLGKRIATFSDKERANFLEQLAPTDRGKALDALMSQVGPGRSSPLITSMMSEILKSWATENFEETLSFSQKCSNDGMRNYMLDQLLEVAAVEDPDRALQLYVDQIIVDPTFRSEVYITVAENKGGESAQQLLDILFKLRVRGSGYAGINVNFSDDYDFRAAADGIAAMIEANPEQHFTVLPMNLLSSWAAADPDAAQAWWAKGGSFMSDDWYKLLMGVEKNSTPEAAAAWTAAKLAEPGAPRERMIQNLSRFDDEANGGRISRIAQAIPEVAAKDHFFNEIIFANKSILSGGYRSAMSGLSSTAARLAAFQKIGAKKLWIDLEEINDAQFQAWGLTRQQVELIVKPK